MIMLILLCCTIAALAVHFAIIRPFLIPLEKRIPNDPRYLPKGPVRFTSDREQLRRQMNVASRGMRAHR